MRTEDAKLYCNTLRYLKPVQLYGPIWRHFYQPRPDNRPASSLRKSSGDWQMPPSRPASFNPPSRFCFLNIEKEIREMDDWNHPSCEHFWLQHLHAFDDLSRADWHDRQEAHAAIIQRWIKENWPGNGAGWNVYPLSLRIVNWIKWMLAGAIPPQLLFDSLATQARYLYPRLGKHLLGHQLFANAKALIFSGIFFEGHDARKWIQKGITVLRREIDEQILEDGAHFELSPMYHSIILEDLLDLINLSQTYPDTLPNDFVDHLRKTERRMRKWLMHLTHPDGEIAFFNDATFDIAIAPAMLEAYAMRLGGEMLTSPKDDMIMLAPSGYVLMHRGNVTLLFDAARIGPDHLSEHAHADTLSFELSWGGQRLLCNSGTSYYGVGQQRQWERSTAAHNTVVIDDADSSEMWGGFRVARRAYPLDLYTGKRSGKLFASAAHDGYRRLHGHPIHRREICVGNDIVTWTDRITSQQIYSSKGYLPLHPDIVVEALQPSRWRLSLPDGTRLQLHRENGQPLHVEEGWYASAFGKLQRRSVLVWYSEDELNLEENFSIRLEYGVYQS